MTRETRWALRAGQEPPTCQRKINCVNGISNKLIVLILDWLAEICCDQRMPADTSRCFGLISWLSLVLVLLSMSASRFLCSAAPEGTSDSVPLRGTVALNQPVAV